MGSKVEGIKAEMRELWSETEVVEADKYYEADYPPMIVEYYGGPGMGKSHCACTWPKPFLIGTEDKCVVIAKKFNIPWKRRIQFITRYIGDKNQTRY